MKRIFRIGILVCSAFLAACGRDGLSVVRENDSVSKPDQETGTSYQQTTEAIEQAEALLKEYYWTESEPDSPGYYMICTVFSYENGKIYGGAFCNCRIKRRPENSTADFLCMEECGEYSVRNTNSTSLTEDTLEEGLKIYQKDEPNPNLTEEEKRKVSERNAEYYLLLDEGEVTEGRLLFCLDKKDHVMLRYDTSILEITGDHAESRKEPLLKSKVEGTFYKGLVLSAAEKKESEGLLWYRVRNEMWIADKGEQCHVYHPEDKKYPFVISPKSEYETVRGEKLTVKLCLVHPQNSLSWEQDSLSLDRDEEAIELQTFLENGNEYNIIQSKQIWGVIYTFEIIGTKPGIYPFGMFVDNIYYGAADIIVSEKADRL